MAKFPKFCPQTLLYLNLLCGVIPSVPMVPKSMLLPFLFLRANFLCFCWWLGAYGVLPKQIWFSSATSYLYIESWLLTHWFFFSLSLPTSEHRWMRFIFCRRPCCWNYKGNERREVILRTKARNWTMAPRKEEGSLIFVFPVTQIVTVTEDSTGNKVNKAVKCQLN